MIALVIGAIFIFALISSDALVGKFLDEDDYAEEVEDGIAS